MCAAATAKPNPKLSSQSGQSPQPPVTRYHIDEAAVLLWHLPVNPKLLLDRSAEGDATVSSSAALVTIASDRVVLYCYERLMPIAVILPWHIGAVATSLDERSVIVSSTSNALDDESSRLLGPSPGKDNGGGRWCPWTAAVITPESKADVLPLKIGIAALRASVTSEVAFNHAALSGRRNSHPTSHAGFAKSVTTSEIEQAFLLQHEARQMIAAISPRLVARLGEATSSFSVKRRQTDEGGGDRIEGRYDGGTAENIGKSLGHKHLAMRAASAESCRRPDEVGESLLTPAAVDGCHYSYVDCSHDLLLENESRDGSERCLNVLDAVPSPVNEPAPRDVSSSSTAVMRAREVAARARLRRLSESSLSWPSPAPIALPAPIPPSPLPLGWTPNDTSPGGTSTYPAEVDAHRSRYPLSEYTSLAGRGELLPCKWCGKLARPDHPRRCSRRLVSCKRCRQKLVLKDASAHACYSLSR